MLYIYIRESAMQPHAWKGRQIMISVIRENSSLSSIFTVVNNMFWVWRISFMGQISEY